MKNIENWWDRTTKEMTLSILRQRLNIPDTVGIFVDDPVCGEETHPGHAGDRLSDPLVLVPKRLVDELLRCDVRVEVVRH